MGFLFRGGKFCLWWEMAIRAKRWGVCGFGMCDMWRMDLGPQAKTRGYMFVNMEQEYNR